MFILALDNLSLMSNHTFKRTNLIITVKTLNAFDLRDVFDKINHGAYNPGKFSALTLHFKNPKCTILIFSTGNITIMGTSTYYGALFVLSKLKEKVQFTITSIKLTNMVVTFGIGAKIDIEKLAKRNSRFCTCNPELFPCCTINIPDTTTKANVFSSGKVVITGNKSEEEAKANIEFVKNFIHNQKPNDDYHLRGL